jgi:hypothetical protein
VTNFATRKLGFANDAEIASRDPHPGKLLIGSRKKIALLPTRLYQSIPMQKQIFALAILALCTSSTFVLGATDTPETRRREAERYLQATPPKAMFEDIADKMAVRRLSERNSNNC